MIVNDTGNPPVETSKPLVRQQVTLIDLWSLLCFTTPFFGAVAMGWKVGVIGLPVGFVVGGVTGVIGIRGFRTVVVGLAKRHQGNISGWRSGFLMIFMFVWLFGLSFAAMSGSQAMATLIKASGAPFVQIIALIALALLARVVSKVVGWFRPSKPRNSE